MSKVASAFLAKRFFEMYLVFYFQKNRYALFWLAAKATSY